MKNGFYDEEIDGITILRCKAFAQEGISHAFTTRLGGVTPGQKGALNLGYSRGDRKENVDENYSRLAKALRISADQIHGNRQVHGRAVRKIEEKEQSVLGKEPMPEADGLITDVKGQALAAFYADCVPILIAHPKSGTVAAVHAGWRGTAAAIVKEAVRRFEEDYGILANELIAAIGPSICASCYEVGEEVKEKFSRQFGEKLPEVIEEENGHLHANLWRANEILLTEAGIPANQISVAEICTKENHELYFSHRTMGDERGVLAAVIVAGKEKKE